MNAYELPILEKIEVKEIDRGIREIISRNVWNIINDKGFSESIIFKDNGTFLQIIDGVTTNGTYEVLEDFGMLHVIFGLKGMMLSPFFEMNGILVWRLDGTSRYVFFIKRNSNEFQVSTYDDLCSVFEEQYEIQEKVKRERLEKQEEENRQKEIAEKKRLAYIESITHNGQQYVDMCLPSGTKWAKCNIGAYRPDSCGQVFVWGEIKSKERYLRKYQWAGGVDKEGEFKIVGNPYRNGRLLLEYDAANVNWGGDWRMPTREEMQELLDNCEVREEGVGYRFVSRKNGESILFPKISSYNHIGSYSGGSFIASSSVSSDMKSINKHIWNPQLIDKVYILDIKLYNSISYLQANYSSARSSDKIEIKKSSRFDEMLIRPVFKEKIYTVYFYVNDDENNVIKVKLLESDILRIPGTPMLFYNLVFKSWNTKQNGKGKQFMYGDEIQVFENLEFYAQWEFCEDINYVEYRGIKFVDLGLSSGTLWSIYNYGAKSHGEYGVFMSWGEMSSKLSNYKIIEFTPDKYPLSDLFNDIKDKNVNEISEELECYRKVSHFWRDAKAVSIRKWPQVPTKKQFEELYYQCIWEESIINSYNVRGWIVRSKKNSNAIFIPAVGYIDGNKQFDNENLMLWTRTIDDNVNMAYVGGDPNTKITSKYRYLGLPIRLVINNEDC